jgi:hypothetical protein
MGATYLDSSAIVKLAVREPESAALRRYLRRRRPLISSALARTEVLRALLPIGDAAVAAGRKALTGVDFIRISIWYSMALPSCGQQVCVRWTQSISSLHTI